MSTYTVNKGVGHDVEFHGLTAQYLVIFAGGLLGCFCRSAVGVWRRPMGKCGYWRRLCFGTCLGYFPTERSLRPLRAAQDRSGPNAAPTYNPPQADQVLVTKNVLIEAL